jgi:sulfotransferase family protein
MSLKAALERLLGAPCYHMVEVFPRPAHFGLWTAAAHGERVDWHALFDGFQAAVDWPASAFWQEISEAFPEAIILLSTRASAEAWWKSASETIFRVATAHRGSPMTAMIEAMFEARFTNAIHDREAAIAAYERHNAIVRATAPRGRLVEWAPKDGWGPLCKALGVAVPAEPFPHVNTTDEFQARVEAGPPPGH